MTIDTGRSSSREFVRLPGVESSLKGTEPSVGDPDSDAESGPGLSLRLISSETGSRALEKNIVVRIPFFFATHSYFYTDFKTVSKVIILTTFL